MWPAKSREVQRNERPKVLIGVTGFQGVMADAQESFFAFAYECGRRNPEYDFFLRIMTKREQFRARNNLVDLAIANNVDYLLMLDDDMIIPPDLFTKLVAHDKPLVGCLYYQRGGAYHPVIMRLMSKKDGFRGVEFINHYDPVLRERGLHQVDVVGGGCLLMKTDIFRHLRQPWFWVDGITGTDVHLCEQLKEAGIPVYCDTSIELGHVGMAPIITSRSIPQYGKRLGEANEVLWNDLKEFYQVTEDQLVQQIVVASEGGEQKSRWEQRDRHTWEDVRAFYTDGEDVAVLSLANYCLKYDETRAWVISESSNTIPRDSVVVDYGAGIGFLTVACAQLYGYHMRAIDLDSRSLEFLRWRVARHGLGASVSVESFDAPTPPDLASPADAVFLVSVLDHLWDPMGALEWLKRNVKSGGVVVCDTWANKKMEDHPQHLIKYDPSTVLREFRRRGFRQAPETPFLFFKEG